MSSTAAILLALPWVAGPVLSLLRGRRSRSLDEESAEAPADAPLVSVIIPARDEARNIRRCVESALASSYPRLEVLVVDDHSSDDTGAIVRSMAEGEPRLRVVMPAPLPAGWFGKQWACAAGADASAGEVLGFMDADTSQAPDLVTRTVNAMRSRGSDMLSVAGSQELGSFWERLVQPQIFAVLLQRYGGTEDVNESRFASQKIANGQCLWFRRPAYLALGGHGAVRDKVAEDLSLAQLVFRSGRTATIVLGLDQLSTRMYTSWRELAEGWGKNIYAGGRDAMPLGALGRAILPLALITPSVLGLLPPLVLALSLVGVLGADARLWASLATAANLTWWLLVYLWLRISPPAALLYAVLHPLGAAALLYIAVRAIVRGRRVTWKAREYQAG